MSYVASVSHIKVKIRKDQVVGYQLLRKVGKMGAEALEFRMRNNIENGIYPGAGSYSTHNLRVSVSGPWYGKNRTSIMEGVMDRIVTKRETAQARKTGRKSRDVSSAEIGVAFKPSGRWMRFKGGYRQFRSEASRGTGAVDMNFTGKMMNDFWVKPVMGKKQDNGTYEFGFTTGSTLASRDQPKMFRHATETSSSPLQFKVGFSTQESANIAEWHQRGMGNRKIRRFVELGPEDNEWLRKYVRNWLGRAQKAGVTGMNNGRFAGVRTRRGNVIYQI